ncbi:peptidylprolyl isomerase [Oceanobacter mangrovi]|uniref:peptidylprolyl isomerase n=1 Tax=Oceanobacter mangrovi TaxID=2862510 RepID=UPI001C8DA00A|nr:peptidylprolyl isomerase [Oceanobacter mangrovi]
MQPNTARISIQHILVRNGELARQLHQELLAGADFAAIASEYSVCPSKEQQGHCGKLAIDDLPTTILQALTPLSEDVQQSASQQTDSQNNLYPAPVQSSFGYHLLKATERLPRSLLADEEVSEPEA